jgi:hypothetical protein
MHAELYSLACFNTELSLVHGVLVCDACGTQAESPVEEEEFLDAGGAPGAFKRRRMAALDLALRSGKMSWLIENQSRR